MNRDSVDSPVPGLWRIDDPLIAPLIPLAARARVLLLWRLDARLAQIAGTGSEPALRQIRMRWWADQLLRLGDGGETVAEPLLSALAAGLPDQADRLADLGEAWVACVSAEDEDTAGARGAALLAATALLLGGGAEAARALGEGWGIADAILAGRVDAAHWPLAGERLNGVSLRSLPRALAALGAASRATARRRGAAAPRRDQLTILRAGLFGG